jgi:hypothetical protein
MTEQDIADALDLCCNDHRSTQLAPVIGLTPRSRKRMFNLARLEGGGDDAA